MSSKEEPHVLLARFIMAGLDVEAALMDLGPEYAGLQDKVERAVDQVVKIVTER